MFRPNKMSGSPILKAGGLSSSKILELEELVLTNNFENDTIVLKTTLGKNLIIEGVSDGDEEDEKHFLDIILVVGSGTEQYIPPRTFVDIDAWKYANTIATSRLIINGLTVDNDGLVEIQRDGMYCISSGLLLPGTAGTGNKQYNIRIVNGTNTRYIGMTVTSSPPFLPLLSNSTFFVSSASVYLLQGEKVGTTVFINTFNTHCYLRPTSFMYPCTLNITEL